MPKRTRFTLRYFLIVLGVILVLDLMMFSGSGVQEISYSQFRDDLAADKIQKVVLSPDKIYGMLKPPAKSTAAAADSAQQAAAARAQDPAAKPDPGKKIVPPGSHTPWRLKLNQWEQKYEKQKDLQFQVVRLQDDKLLGDLQTHHVDYRGKLGSNRLENFLFNWIIPFGLLFLLWGYLMRRMGKGPNVLSIGRNKAKVYEVETAQRVTFNDVAGIDEAVEEVKEVVDFLQDPRKYTRLGAKLPKGILLVGPPGSGKTLLARAVAGEAHVPFFSMTGSDFVEMFVGVGAARVRDLFAQANLKAPCIIFIDELDAVGSARGQGPFAAGYSERDNTLNQLLTEMDGFDPRVGIIMMAATNRPEVLDQALLRPGRFDRQILVDRPDLTGREQIFKIHTRGLLLAADVDLHKLAAETPGFAGADIANICNEAALLGSRKGHQEIAFNDFQEAIERVVAGLEKRNKLINKYERRVVAYHESGHAIIGHFTPGADPVQKVSIVPRGIGALGYTLQTPLEDRYLMSRTELIGRIKGLLGGRAAEEVTFDEISTGASNDLERATKIAREMLTVYGMSRKMPNISLVGPQQSAFLGQGPQSQPHSDKIEELIDEEVFELINNCYEEDKKLLRDKRDKLEKLARTLLEQETIDDLGILAILGARPGPTVVAGAE
jgi:cell division protease FtsH